MVKKLLIVLVAVAAVVAAALWAIAAPAALPETTFEGVGEPDIENGRLIFAAGGCASCHAAPDAEEAAGGEEGAESAPVLAGGLAIESEFGTFHVPNISPSPQGIGDWSFEAFANAMLRGVSPGGGHYYPAFPYGSYTLMEIGDVNDLWGYLQTLPESDNIPPDHDVGFPFGIRRGVGLWKYLYMPDDYRVPIATDEPAATRGQYLVEAVGHCGECHTPRTFLGGLNADRWLAGAPNPDGDGRIPDISPGGSIDDWSVGDLAYYFESGFTPEFDVVGGSMAEVQRGLAQLPESDREAIAAYLKALPE
jgi:mono/diheme cytochrome c family protein